MENIHNLKDIYELDLYKEKLLNSNYNFFLFQRKYPKGDEFEI
jgi:hypothetical protein